MFKTSLRWLMLAIAILFVLDEASSLLDPWRGLHEQWLTVFMVVAFLGPLLLLALLKAAFTFGIWRLGSGDMERGRKIFDARMAQRKRTPQP